MNEPGSRFRWPDDQLGLHFRARATLTDRLPRLGHPSGQGQSALPTIRLQESYQGETKTLPTEKQSLYAKSYKF